MRVVLFRHGPAGTRDASHWPDDAARPLTTKGEQRTRAASEAIARLEGELTLVLTSPLTRAMQTARLLAGACADAEIEVLDALAPGGSYRAIIDHLAGCATDGAVALVGHEPDLGKLAGTLIFGAPHSVSLKKAGACAIEFEGPPGPGAGRLLWFLPPRLLRRLGRKKARV